MTDTSNAAERRLELLDKRRNLEKELGQLQQIANKALQDKVSATEQVRRAKERLKVLRQALRHMQTEAEILLLSEYKDVVKLIADNTEILLQYETLVASDKQKGEKALVRFKFLQATLKDVDSELSTYGRILSFPRVRPATDDDDVSYEDDRDSPNEEIASGD